MTPILESDLNELYSISFKFSVPPVLLVPNYDWKPNAPIFGTNSTGGQSITYPSTTEPKFPGFEIRTGGTSGTAGTNINYVSEVLRNESFLFESKEPFSDIEKFNSIFEKISGDTDLLQFIKMFRFSDDGFTWSNWKELNITNLNENLVHYVKYSYIQFRYDAIELDNPDFDDRILIDKPDKIGWIKIHSDGTPFTFDVNYPDKGTLEYVVGYGNDGDYFIRTDLGDTRLYGPKNNGYWGSPLIYTQSGSNIVPTSLTQEILDSASTGGFLPIDDYTMSSFDIRFGKEELDTAEFRIPLKGDLIFLNPLFQNIDLKGVETLKINHTPRNIDPKYVSRLYLEELSLFADKEIFDASVISCLENIGDQVILKPPFTLKVFKLEDFCLDAKGLTDDRTIDVQYRWSNNQKQWSPWMPMTSDNLKCIKSDPLSFFYLEILFTRTGTDETGKICICDLTLLGDYQNVTRDGKTGNRFGLREDCSYNGEDGDGTGSGTTIPPEWDTNKESECYVAPSFNPYDINRSVELNNKLANDVSDMFGWAVDYYKTTPDSGGTDPLIHEYQLFNVSAKSEVKVIVPNNQFPDNTIMFNQFDLSLFDTFEIHITRDEFYRRFGVGIRPAKRDFLFFCQVNRMYQVEHAQSYREFMNSSIYYKVVLKKYQDRKNIDNGDYKDPLQDLLKDNSLDNLFKDVVKEETNKVANKEILENLTEKAFLPVEPHVDDDVIIEPGEEPRKMKIPQPKDFKIYATNVKSDLQNGPNIIAKNYYDLSTRVNQDALIYQTIDNNIEKGPCGNRSFVVWFNITEYVVGQYYNMIDNYNTVTNQGYKIDFVDGRFEIIFGTQVFDIDVNVRQNCWTGLIINFNQEQHNLDLALYSIKADQFATSTELDLIEEHRVDLIPEEITGDLTLRLKGSPMHWTSMRLFGEIIPKDKYQKVLNQYIVQDTSKLILADNVNQKVISPHWKF